MPHYPKFERAPARVNKLAAALVRKYHKEISEAKVSFDFVFCRATTNEQGQPTGPALMKHGAPAVGIARIVSLKERSMGRADAEISIDADQFEEWSAEEQEALLDHELFHFEPKKNEAGVYVRDDLGRPKLSMRHHDHTFGWFDVIADRHGEASCEVQQAKALFEKKDTRQIYFPFAEKVMA